MEAATKTQGKHTPGPWSLRFEDMPLSHPGVPFEIEKGGFLISGTCAAREQSDGLFSNDEARANARLIATAPDLLAACKGALNDLHHPGAHVLRTGQSIVDFLEAVIAKAEAAQ